MNSPDVGIDLPAKAIAFALASSRAFFASRSFFQASKRSLLATILGSSTTGGVVPCGFSGSGKRERGGVARRSLSLSCLSLSRSRDRERRRSLERERRRSLE